MKAKYVLKEQRNRVRMNLTFDPKVIRLVKQHADYGHTSISQVFSSLAVKHLSDPVKRLDDEIKQLVDKIYVLQAERDKILYKKEQGNTDGMEAE